MEQFAGSFESEKAYQMRTEANQVKSFKVMQRMAEGRAG